MAQPNRFWNWIARRYARTPVADEAAYREKLARTQARLDPGWRMLEIGCGTGSTALEHAPHVGEILAIDFAPAMIEICREKAAAAGIDNIRFETATIDSLQIAPGSFDAALAMSILHLVEDRDAVIAKLFDALRPGGLFVSSTICLAGRARLLRSTILPLGNLLGLLPRIAAFSREDLATAIEAAGFEIEEIWQPGEAPSKAVFIIARKPD
ncbi:class I SAM-dependent methyltransferase [Tropicimonas sp. IMCC6043]|uniref:class I SAM-dependent methyltransferase n=1 Tax=Tropicimonas sp. IMCC6043 TaxID=2510645 RepID=UPI00101C660D|nr:class I SAM-dependent methyltransferase [Tropicimonas sp. IMCC6043]RYH08094.1 class I SAM-dependent methyltransferase [Tropicimonas sp. IMCC6043]